MIVIRPGLPEKALQALGIDKQGFKPLLPRQRLAAGKAQVEMQVAEILQRVKTGATTAEDAQTLQRAFNTLRGNHPC